MQKGIYFKKILALFILLSVAGCSNLQSNKQRVVESYSQIASQVKLGMDKETVKKILTPSQVGLSLSQSKLPDQHKEGDTQVDILYFRSAWQRDGIVTDDEFTPYIFNDGILVAIGWTTLGGPKTQAQARPEDKIFHQRMAVFL